MLLSCPSTTRALSLIFLSVFMYFNGFAQTEIGEAVISMNNGKVVSSYVKVDPDELNFVIIKNEKGQEQLIDINKLENIRFDNGSKYISHKVSNKPSAQVRLFKAVVESKGGINLYVRWEPGKTFYVTKGDSIYKLENNEEIVLRNEGEPTNAGKSGHFKRYDYAYAKVLGVLMGDRVDLAQDIQKTELSERDLTRLILDYNKGEVTYHLASGSRLKSPPNNLIYAQASTIGSFLFYAPGKIGTGFSGGWHFYPRANGRFSLKLGFEHATFQFLREDSWTGNAYGADIVTTGLSSSMQYEFVKRSAFQSYIGMRLFDLSQFNETYRGESESYLMAVPRLSPCLGLQFIVNDRLAVYGEVNHILQMGSIFRSASIGVSYDFGRVTRF